MGLFQRATYHITVSRLEDLPQHTLVEVAFAGRSNAGKSSAINALAHRRRLAFVSKTPGRTQLLNFFQLGGGRYLVDLPGYGFAQAPGTVRGAWDRLVGGYLRNRTALAGMVLFMDARHPLTPLDRRMLTWFAATGKPVHVCLTKADKLTRQQALATLRKVRDELADSYPLASVQLFSSSARMGLEEAEAAITRWLPAGETVETSALGLRQ